MVIIAVSVLVAVIGAFMYGFATNDKVQKMGLVLFFWGVGWALYFASNRTAHLL